MVDLDMAGRSGSDERVAVVVRTDAGSVGCGRLQRRDKCAYGVRRWLQSSAVIHVSSVSRSAVSTVDAVS